MSKKYKCSRSSSCQETSWRKFSPLCQLECRKTAVLTGWYDICFNVWISKATLASAQHAPQHREPTGSASRGEVGRKAGFSSARPFCNGCQWHLVILLPSAGWPSSSDHAYHVGLFSSAGPVHPVTSFVTREQKHTTASPLPQTKLMIRKKCTMQRLHNGGVVVANWAILGNQTRQNTEFYLLFSTNLSYTQIINNHEHVLSETTLLFRRFHCKGRQ